MEDLNMNKLNESELSAVDGGAASASGVNCRYTPNGEIAKVYERGHRLKVDGITADGEWYRLLIYDPRGGTCYAYIYKQYTRRIRS